MTHGKHGQQVDCKGKHGGMLAVRDAQKNDDVKAEFEVDITAKYQAQLQHGSVITTCRSAAASLPGSSRLQCGTDLDLEWTETLL